MAKRSRGAHQARGGGDLQAKRSRGAHQARGGGDLQVAGAHDHVRQRLPALS